MSKHLRTATAILDEAEATTRSPTAAALAKGGMRTATATAEQVTAGLASRFYRPHNNPVTHNPLGQGEFHHDTPLRTVQAHVCPRCKKPSSTVRLANRAEVHYCENGCRYVVPMPSTDLLTEN